MLSWIVWIFEIICHMLGKLKQHSFIQQVFAKHLPCARPAIDQCWMEWTKPVVSWSSHSNEGDRQQGDIIRELLSSGRSLCHCSSWLARRAALSLCHCPFGGKVGGVGLLSEKWHSGEQEAFCLPYLVARHLEEQRVVETGMMNGHRLFGSVRFSELSGLLRASGLLGRPLPFCGVALLPRFLCPLGLYFKTHPSNIMVKNHLPFLEPSPKLLQRGIDYSLLLGLVLLLLTTSVNTVVP